MARHGKKPSEESTSSHTPRTLAGSATTCTSADSTDAAASGIAVNSSTVSSAFASDADGNTGNTLVGNASDEVEATEVETNATSTNATGERTISSSNTAEISNRQSHESSESSESRQPQDLFDAAIAQGISVFGFTGVRASQQMRDLAALNDCKEAVTAMNTSYSKAFQLKAKISEAFTSFDGSYDLDKLAELHQTEVTAPKTLSCAADTSATISKANAAKAEYDKQAKQFKQALQKSDESAATDGGDGTDNSADGTAGDDGTDEATDTEGDALKFRHFQDFTAIKCSNKSKEKCKTRERPNERKGGSHELDSGKWSRDHR